MFRTFTAPFGTVARRLTPQYRRYLIGGFTLFLLAFILILSPELITDHFPVSYRLEKSLQKAHAASARFLKTRNFADKYEVIYQLEQAKLLAPNDPAVIALEHELNALPIGWTSEQPDAKPFYESPPVQAVTSAGVYAVPSVDTDTLRSYGTKEMMYQHAQEKAYQDSVLAGNAPQAAGE